MKAPFKEFAILNIYGEEISTQTTCVVPYSDIDNYQYHIVGQKVTYKVGNIRRTLNWENDELQLNQDVDSVRKSKKIPYEGNLTTLFDSREEIRLLLEQTSRNLLAAEVPILFWLSGGRTITLIIKEFPFIPWQEENGRVVIVDENQEPIGNKGFLKLLNLNNPDKPCIECSFNEEQQCYLLPEDILSWGDTLLFGRSKGRIRPMLVNLRINRNEEQRKTHREDCCAKIKDKLSHASLNDEFWKRIQILVNRAQEEDIPASSILEFYCIAQSSTYLLYFTLQLYCKFWTSDDRDNLAKWLLDKFSNPLAFQWYWLQPCLSQLKSVSQDFMCPSGNFDSIGFKELYAQWSLQQDNKFDYLMAMADSQKYNEFANKCFTSIFQDFSIWMQQICFASLLDSYKSTNDSISNEAALSIIMGKECHRIETDRYTEVYIDTNQESLSESATNLFEKYSDGGCPPNEQWLRQRVNIVVRHLRGQLNLFDLPDECRRSVIYASKSCNTQFVKLLNNKLVQ
jgi:hypothetical protein